MGCTVGMWASPSTQKRYETRECRGFAEGEAPVSKSWEQVEGERECRQPDEFYGDEPSEGVEHEGIIL